MPDLDRLMALPGSLAAFEFTDRGELVDHRVASGSTLTDVFLDLVSHICVANLAIATMQARGWEAMTGDNGYYPPEGFTLLGFEWSAVASGRFGVVLANERADYDAAFAALREEGA
jgi:roadblock/LC7 domain-containing protein